MEDGLCGGGGRPRVPRGRCLNTRAVGIMGLYMFRGVNVVSELIVP